jgi:hypothetical protein
MQKPKAKFVNLALPRIDPADDGPEVEIIRRERITISAERNFYQDFLARYEHSGCAGCKYLGQFAEYDLYFCPQNGDKTVLARHSSEPSEYLSGWGSRMVPLLIAEALAYRKGFVA